MPKGSRACLDVLRAMPRGIDGSVPLRNLRRPTSPDDGRFGGSVSSQFRRKAHTAAEARLEQAKPAPRSYDDLLRPRSPGEHFDNMLAAGGRSGSPPPPQSGHDAWHGDGGGAVDSRSNNTPRRVASAGQLVVGSFLEPQQQFMQEQLSPVLLDPAVQRSKMRPVSAAARGTTTTREHRSASPPRSGRLLPTMDSVALGGSGRSPGGAATDQSVADVLVLDAAIGATRVGTADGEGDDGESAYYDLVDDDASATKRAGSSLRRLAQARSGSDGAAVGTIGGDGSRNAGPRAAGSATPEACVRVCRSHAHSHLCWQFSKRAALQSMSCAVVPASLGVCVCARFIVAGVGVVVVVVVTPFIRYSKFRVTSYRDQDTLQRLQELDAIDPLRRSSRPRSPLLPNFNDGSNPTAVLEREAIEQKRARQRMWRSVKKKIMASACVPCLSECRAVLACRARAYRECVCVRLCVHAGCVPASACVLACVPANTWTCTPRVGLSPLCHLTKPTPTKHPAPSPLFSRGGRGGGWGWGGVGGPGQVPHGRAGLLGPFHRG